LQPEIESSILSISTINIKDSMIIKPLKKKILVAENKSETKSDSGIILDNAASVRESKRATVLAIGPDVTLVKEGDVVLLEWTKGTVVKVDDAQRVMIDEEFVVAVFD
jgi:co-chaperonin GroES (HSP10)